MRGHCYDAIVKVAGMRRLQFQGPTRVFGPEAAEGGPLALVENGDIIAIDAETGTIDLKVDAAILARRRCRNPHLRRHLSHNDHVI